MHRVLKLVRRSALVAGVLALSACGEEDATVAPPATTTPTARATVVPSPTSTRTVPLTPSITASPTPTPSSTPAASSTHTGTPTPVPTAPAAAVVVEALRQALDPLCDTFGILMSFEVSGDHSFYQMRCVPTAGHEGSLTIESFGNEGAAENEFRRALGTSCLDIATFHDLSVATCRVPFRQDDGRIESWVWRSGCWLVHARASDDTDFLLSPDPDEVSEAVFGVAAGLGLFDSCPEAHDDRADLIPTFVGSTVHYGDCRGPFAFLRVCVANSGGQAAGPFLVSINGAADEFLVEPGLQPGESLCVDRPFRQGEVTVEVDRDDRVVEHDQNNNSLTGFAIDPTVPATCPRPTSTPTPPP